MAAASPIVLNSSSPVSYQIPAITPPSEQKKSRILVGSSSSPGLVSPSTFLKSQPRPTGLKSGSRAQQAPDGVQIGFAIAGSLWNVHDLEQAKRQDDEAAEQNALSERSVEMVESKRESTGKLVKPKKMAKKQQQQQQQDEEPPEKKQKLEEDAYMDLDEPIAKSKKRRTEVMSKASAEEEFQVPNSTLADYGLDADIDPQSHKDDGIEGVAAKQTRKSKKADKQDEEQSHLSKDLLQSEASPGRLVKSPVVEMEDFASKNYTERDIARAPEKTSMMEASRPQNKTVTNSRQDDTSMYFERERNGMRSESLHMSTSPHVISLSRFALDQTADEAGQDIEKAGEEMCQPRNEPAYLPETDDFPDTTPIPASVAERQAFGTFTEYQPGNLAQFALAFPMEPKDATKPVHKAAPKSNKSRPNANRESKARADLVETPAKKNRKRKKKSESIILNSDEPELYDRPATTSNYFSKTRPNADEAARICRQSPPREQCRLDSAEKPVTCGAILPAASRRREWTPVEDSILPDLTVERTDGNEIFTADSDTSAGPKRQLLDVLGGLAYVSNETGIGRTERAVTGEAITKRRRIELASIVGIQPTVLDLDKVTEQALAKPAKQKKRRKKAQTITALATAAFQSANEAQPDDGAVSHFFPPSKPNPSSDAETEGQPAQKVKKPRNPRKHKEKLGAAATNAKPKTSKPKKAKVKFNEADYTPKLYSPGRATAQLRSQNFLFGTSSQLAMDEPASFIRDMQVAMQESEQQPGSKFHHEPASSQMPLSQAQLSSQGKSCTTVPTAPHGTCLSIEQARRELWCVSTRDSQGSVLRSEDGDAIEPLQHTEQSAPLDRLPIFENALEPNTEAHVEEQLIRDIEDVVVNLCNTSPLTTQERAKPSCTNAKDSGAQEEECDRVEQPALEQAVNHSDDWMLIESSSPLTNAQPVGTTRAPPAAFVCANLRDSKLLSPKRFRPPLSPLNPNTLMNTSWVQEKSVIHGQLRVLSSTTATKERKSRSKSPGKRGPGRPRKDSASGSPSANAPKRRGRPPKSKALTSEPSQLLKPKKRKIAPSASQPIEEAGFIDIDDIYDSDLPTTPSPPRRRSTSSQRTVQPLALSPSIQAKAPAAAAAALKSKESQWADIRSDLFDRIMAVIKSLPPSNNASKPTWYEKILLYDPIVLEDLTAWLNDQGLRVETKKQKAKPKKKGRKRKDADVVDGEQLEWEVQHEPLQAWMVQKFCEEKSICCLWKEGLRGGVRTRY